MQTVQPDVGGHAAGGGLAQIMNSHTLTHTLRSKGLISRSEHSNVYAK